MTDKRTVLKKVGTGITEQILPFIEPVPTEQEKDPALVRMEAALDEADKVEVHDVRGMSYKVAHLLALEPTVRHAMVIALWDSQILNGGIDQWQANGFGSTLPYLILACEAVGTPHSTRVLEMATEAVRRADDGNYDDQCSEDICHLQGDTGPFDALDDEYYTFQEAFLLEVATKFFPA